MKAKYSNYIVIKGVDWLMRRLDAINYPPCNKSRTAIFKGIWKREKWVSDELLRAIIGYGNEEKAG